MLLSIIIPSFNVERFIEKAMQSVLEQKEVTEIVVVDDGSTDTTIQIVKVLQSKYPIIKLYHHPYKLNKGRSATRNLGIQKATGDYIAFLDADDYFLPNRFTNDFKLFQEIKDCDGVYNAVGFHFYRKATEDELISLQLYTVRQKVAPEDLFKNLLYGKCGHFHINGLTVKKKVFEETGFFNEELVVAEDSEMFWKMAIKCRLETGIIDKALAVRGVHENNIFDNEKLYRIYTIRMHETLAIWSSKNGVNKAVTDDILKWIWMLKFQQRNKLYQDIVAWARFFFSQPQLLFTIYSIKYFPVVRFRQMLFPFLYCKKKQK